MRVLYLFGQHDRAGAGAECRLAVYKIAQPLKSLPAEKFQECCRLEFDRARTKGFRLDIAAGTAIRFEPGQKREVRLVALAGKRQAIGFRKEVMGKV